ncbi:MAG: M20/M25/M40 family metallo-hydrolase [Halioglobus sp.]|nr:M20/M25/M40 family metallo-hydrolase [Halioglobus sp.]
MTRYLATLALALLFIPPASAAGTAPERLAEAVRFRTVSYQDRSLIDYGEFERLNAYLRETFPLSFARLETETVSGYSLLLRWPGSNPELAPVLFTAHTDVVPIEPGTEQDWVQPPFGGVIADGRIYGRGTLDDKQGVMGLLEATESLVAAGFQPERTLVLAFGHDEEISGRDGAQAIAAVMRERDWHFTWMVDEGGMILRDNPLLPGRESALINIAEKGYLTLTLVARGEGGHSSRPPKISTIGRLSAALTRIENNPFPAELVEPVEAMLRAVAPYADQPERFIFSNLWLTGGMVADRMRESPLTQSFVQTTTALTMFNAGIKENVVPQQAEAKVNFRLLPGQTFESVIQRITDLVDDPEIEILHDGWAGIPPVAQYPGGGFDVIARAINEEYPDTVVLPSLLTATTDTRHYIDVADDLYRFHGMVVEADQASSIHGTGEYIGIESYEKMIAIAERMLRFAAAP